MDGPYAVEISKDRPGMLHLRMFACDRQIAEGDADIQPLVSELSSQSRKLLNECRLRDWWSPDAEVLELHLLDVERELATERA